jgi:hypothetical protein
VLINENGFRVVYEHGINLDAKLAIIVKDWEWFWPHARSDAMGTIVIHPDPLRDDSVIWKDMPKGVFTAGSACELIQYREIKVNKV